MKVSKAKMFKSKNITNADIERAKNASLAAWKRLSKSKSKLHKKAARSAHAYYCSLKSIQKKRQEIADEKKLLEFTGTRSFLIGNRKVAVDIIDSEFVIYNNNCLNKLTPKTEKQLDALVATSIGHDELELVRYER